MSFTLTPDEFRLTSLQCRDVEIFPQHIISSLLFTPPKLEYDKPLSLLELLSLPYFGPAPIPASYEGFKQAIEQAYNEASQRGDLGEMSLSEAYNEACQEYGFNGLNDFQKIYKELEKLSKEQKLPIYASYEKLCDSSAYIDAQMRSGTSKLPFSRKGKRAYVDTFKQFSPYYWDILIDTHRGKFSDIWIDHLNGKVVYLHKADEGVDAYIIFSTGYLRGINSLNSARIGLTSANEKGEVKKISQLKFGDLHVNFKNLPSSQEVI